MTSTTDRSDQTDGRRARAERGRRAAVAAMVDLVEEGHLPPTPEQVADRAGISVASVYRYFDSLDDLKREMAIRYFERHADLFAIPQEGEGTLDHRITTLVRCRVRLFAMIAPVSKLGRSRAVDSPALDIELRRSRQLLADQVRRQFAPELDGLTPAAADDLATALSATVAIQSWEHLQDDLGRSDRQIARTWRLALTRLLSDR